MYYTHNSMDFYWVNNRSLKEEEREFAILFLIQPIQSTITFSSNYPFEIFSVNNSTKKLEFICDGGYRCPNKEAYTHTIENRVDKVDRVDRVDNEDVDNSDLLLIRLHYYKERGS